MMAEKVTIHYIIDDGWADVYAYVYDKNKTGEAAEITGTWPGTKCLDNDIKVVDGKRVATWTVELGSTSVSDALVMFTNNKGSQHPASGEPGWPVENGASYSKDYKPTESGGSEVVTKEIKLFNGSSVVTGSNGNYTLDLSIADAKDATIKLSIGGANYGLAAAKTISAAGTSDIAFTTGGTEALTLKAGLLYSITVTDEGKMTVVATEKWDTEKTNRLKGRVYTQGFYLAGNFFSFSKNKFNNIGEDKVTYDDAVFKFQQQKNDATIESGKDYEVYMVEIPASLDAHAQVMYVDESGKTVKLFGPTSACGISETYPKTVDKSTNWETLNGTETFSENNNYWNFSTRNKRQDEYSDGLYEVYIAVDKESHEPVKWKITHQAKKRVAYFISDAPDATAMPLYDIYKQDGTQFANKFFATVNLAANRSYYVISNYIYNNSTVNDAKDYGAFDPNTQKIPSPTTNKLFLQGNGGLDFKGTYPDNVICPNLAPLKVGKNNWGIQIVEYNPSRGSKDAHGTPLGFCGDLQLRNDRIVLTSVSLVGDAIPGTLNADGSWNYASNVADMTYDDTEQCYKVTIVTTAADGEKHFRFVGNRNEKITWFENTNTDKREMAKHPHNVEGPLGHTADANDPNKVNYTQEGNPKSEGYDSWNIIWNRPTGRWTVRLYFHTHSDGNDPTTDYYYTITASKDMVLHDVTDIVYGSETNKQNITNLGDYKFIRTWSSRKAWKISNKVDVFVVDNVAQDESSVKLSLKNINKADDTGNYNVIPAKTGVILATKSAASDIAGSQYIARQNYTSYNELVIPMEANESDDVYAGKDNLLEPLYESKVVPASDENNYNYFFAYYNARIATKDEVKYGEKDYLLGFWISKGSKPYQSNSSYLRIPKEKAATLNRLGTSYDNFYTGGSAKKVPGVIFDFDNVGGTTGINEVVNLSTKLNDGKYYTLSGQQVEKPTAGGIYIHNGRKFVVK